MPRNERCTISQILMNFSTPNIFRWQRTNLPWHRGGTVCQHNCCVYCKLATSRRNRHSLHRSQNRIESYHQLRSVITQVSGKKHLIGHTDLEIAISNQCGRLLANVVIAYNSVLLSALLDLYQAEGNAKALAMLKKISPVAWQHIHFLGHYAFRDPGQTPYCCPRRCSGNVGGKPDHQSQQNRR